MTKEERDKIYDFIDKNVKPLERHYYAGDAVPTEKGVFMREVRYFLNSIGNEDIDKHKNIEDYLNMRKELEEFADYCGFDEWCAHAVYVLQHNAPKGVVSPIIGTYSTYHISEDEIEIIAHDENDEESRISIPIEAYYTGCFEDYADHIFEKLSQK